MLVLVSDNVSTFMAQAFILMSYRYCFEKLQVNL